MSSASTPAESTPERERRRHIRACFSPVRRPLLHLPDGVHQVLNISLFGLRIRHADPLRPMVGEQIAGTLQFCDRRASIPLQGTIVRVQPADLVIVCDEGTVPAGWVLEEAARERDGQEGMASHD